MRKSVQWHVGDVVRKLREERGWTQEELAEKAGIGRQAVVKVEHDNAGQRKGNLAKVAKALGSSEPELYGMVPRRTVIEPQRGPSSSSRLASDQHSDRE
jgi:transcriptional regulator with XRE-family HTH domain